MINLVNFTVNNLGYNSPVGLLLIDALARNNIEVPRLCYHEELSIAGNCRLCLVEVKGSFKPAACCALNINQSMQLFTNTKMVKLARENSLEFMLINHPLDCPVCDQGGECDLQDQSYVFGGDRGRFYEEKRAVEDEFISPVIKVILTRCIHCTRCVRFFEEVSGTPFLGMINRGCNMQISTFTKSNIIDFELSGNAIDLCPVGALTFKASAFKGRAWEFQHGYTVDCFDTFCADIRVDYKNNNQVIRIIPNPSARNSFISDKTRLTYDVLNYKLRYNAAYKLFDKKEGLYAKQSWIEILEYLTQLFYTYLNNRIISLGNFLDLYTLLDLKNLLYYTQGSNDANIISDLGWFNENISVLFGNQHLFTSFLHLLEKKLINSLLLVNLNLRLEIPILNAKLRYYSLNSPVSINIMGDIGAVKYNFKFIHAGNMVGDLYDFCWGNHWLCNQFIDYVFEKKKFTINFIGYGINNMFMEVCTSFTLLKTEVNKINIINEGIFIVADVVNTNMSLINSFFLNLYYQTSTEIFKDYDKKNCLYYSFNEDIVNVDPKKYVSVDRNSSIKVYQGLYIEIYKYAWVNHGYNVVIPVKNLFEYDTCTFSFEGQIKNFIKIFNKIDFYTHSNILNFLLQNYISKYIISNVNFYTSTSDDLSITWHFNIIKDFYNKNYFELLQSSPIFIYSKASMAHSYYPFPQPTPLYPDNIAFRMLYYNYYNSDFISKLSKLMNKCLNLFKKDPLVALFEAYDDED